MIKLSRKQTNIISLGALALGVVFAIPIAIGLAPLWALAFPIIVGVAPILVAQYLEETPKVINKLYVIETPIQM